MHKIIRLLLIIYYYFCNILYLSIIRLNHGKFITYWETEFYFFNYLNLALDCFFLNNKNGKYLTMPPIKNVSYYYRLNSVNYWKLGTVYDLKVFFHRKINNLSIFSVIKYKVNNWYIKNICNLDLLVNMYYTSRDIYICLLTPFIVSVYFTNRINRNYLCLIDMHTSYLNLSKRIDLNSYYFDDHKNHIRMLEVYDAVILISYFKFGFKLRLFIQQISVVYLLYFILKYFNFDIFFLMYFWLNCFICSIFWGILNSWVDNLFYLDSEKFFNFLYFGKYFRDLHFSLIARKELDVYNYNRWYTTHVTGRNGLERYLWTYWSCYLWAKDCDLAKLKKVKDFSSEESTQLHIHDLSDNFYYQNEIKLYFDKYSFASFYFNFGKNIERLVLRRSTLQKKRSNLIYNNNYNRYALVLDRGCLDRFKDWDVTEFKD